MNGKQAWRAAFDQFQPQMSDRSRCHRSCISTGTAAQRRRKKLGTTQDPAGATTRIKGAVVNRKIIAKSLAGS
jgi:hypothetical protein